MTGVWHSVAAIALSTISVTPAATVAAPVGADGVPATRLSFIHQYTVWAPRARSSPALTVPEVAATTPGRPKTSFRNDTEPSAYSTHRGPDIRQAAEPSRRSRRRLAEAQSRAQRDDDDGDLRHGAKG